MDADWDEVSDIPIFKTKLPALAARFRNIPPQIQRDAFIPRTGAYGAIEVARFALPPPGKHAMSTPITTLAFDTHQELLWVGNQFGRVTSFAGIEAQKYTSFKAHSPNGGPVRQLLFHDKGVIAISPRSVHMASRRGSPVWHIQHEDMKDLHCMSFTSRGTSEILVAGHQEHMFVIDVNKGEITKQVHTKDHYSSMKRSRYICAAVGTRAGPGPNTTGVINILDSTTFAVVHHYTAHTGGISDFDAQHDFIVACGITLRQGTTWMHDHFISVFDLKNLKMLQPVSFPAGAAHVRMHPRMSTTATICSYNGQLHVVDLMNITSNNIKQVIASYVTGIELASSGEALAIADGDNYIQLWGSPSRIRFADAVAPIEREDYQEPQVQIGWGIDVPLSSVGMPYYRDVLLSAWPSHILYEVGAPPVKVEQHFLNTLKRDAGFLSGTNTKSTRRNQIEDTRNSGKATASIQAPKFLSEKARDAGKESESGRRISDVADALGAAELSSLKAEVPVMYRNVEIKYSKFGVDDFDFGFYNKTRLSGLEIHISNSYANPLLQLLHFTPLFRNLALQHTATACVNEACLLCEMGFLFDMLEKAEGSICQATNLLKTLSSHPQAAQLGLLEEENHSSSLTTMLQGLNRFLMERLSQDFRSMPPHSAAFDQLLLTHFTTSIKCLHCRSDHVKIGAGYVNELMYPETKSNPRNARAPKVTFSQILKKSIERASDNRGWCNRCSKYQTLRTQKTIHSIPPVLLLNAAIASPEARLMWGAPGWLPDEIGIIIDERGSFFCYEGDEIKMHLQRQIHKIKVYSLVGLAADVDSGQHQKSHLVSLINVAHSQETAPAESAWHLFNDFLVRPVKKEEALSFNTAWKLPSIIAYQVKEAINIIDNSWKANLDTSLLYTNNALLPAEKTYTPLSPSAEQPIKGSIIALDTEFVSIRQPEIEMSASGERATIRPIVYALARVSVIRGPSENFRTDLEPGTPFIDDYIKTTEPIVDYLTSYSGIQAGDLDPMVSKHHLVSLKQAYKKLWILLNLGCVFLGHGLKQDFRVANIHVPRAQVIDTAEFFFVKERLRKLSLAFLAWCVLREEIQTGNHDSIEDARTALKLYLKYLEFTDAGIMEVMLRDIYAKGREMGFKPPGRIGAVTVPALEGNEFLTPKKK